MTTITRLRIDILRQLSAGDMSSRDLASICGRTTTATAQALLQMADSGLVRAVGFAPSRLRGAKPRMYRVTEKGLKALELSPDMSGLSNLARMEVAA